MKKVIYSIILALFLSVTVFAQEGNGLVVIGDGGLKFPLPMDLNSYQAGAGTAVEFDGTNDFIEIPHFATYNDYFFSGGLTIEFWFSPDTLLGDQTWVSKLSTTNDSGYVVRTVGSNLLCSLKMGNSWVVTSFPIIEKKWQHVAFVVTSGGGLFKWCCTEFNYHNARTSC
jgi:hypothetical protein